jgi:ketosteroid isomerase-like protein
MEVDHKAALQAYIEATNTHDFNQVRRLLADDAVYWFSDKTWWEGYHEGRLVSGSGRATNMFIKNGESYWKLVHEHLSSN